jgi:hypothetical protein
MRETYIYTVLFGNIIGRDRKVGYVDVIWRSGLLELRKRIP